MPLSRARLVIFALWAVAVMAMLASIIGVARVQVARGEDFRFAAQAAPTDVVPYASRGGTDVADLRDRQERTAMGLQTVGFMR